MQNKNQKLNISKLKKIINQKKMYFTNEEYMEIQQEKRHYEDSRAAIIGTLKIVQKNRGWIEDDAINAIADLLFIPASDVEGIATFYSKIYRKPVGKNIIYYCDSIVCYINNYQSIEKKIIQLLQIQPGQTTADRNFTLLPTCCLGNCDKSPIIMINEDTYNYVKPSDIEFLLEKYQ